MSRATLITVISLAFVSFQLYAQEGADHPLFKDDWLVRVGANQADADARVGLANENTGNIPIVDLNKLGVDTTFTSLYANLIWQKPDRWNWSLTYFESRAAGDRVTDSDISFGDLEIPAGTGITSDFTTRFLVLNGAYDILDRSDQVAGVGFGIYSLDLDASIGSLQGGDFIGEIQSTDTLAPLPTISLYYRRAFNEKWAIMADAGYFPVKYDKYDGDIVTARLTIDYWFNEHWGIGGGYSLVDVDLDIDENLYDERYDVNWDSFFLYLTFGF